MANLKMFLQVHWIGGRDQIQYGLSGPGRWRGPFMVKGIARVDDAGLDYASVRDLTPLRRT